MTRTREVEPDTDEAEHPAKRRKLAKGICHLCSAGQNNIPWEDFFSRAPIWMGTCFKDAPFKQATPFSRLPHVPGQIGSLFAYDTFHAIHLGVAKIHVSSSLGLMSDWMPGGTLPQRFAVLAEDFRSWCKVYNQAPPMGRITPSFIGWAQNSKTDFPCGSWHKGSVTTVLMRYIEWKLTHMNVGDNHQLLKLALEATTSLNVALKTLYETELFLKPEESGLIGNLGLRFLRRFAVLSKLCQKNGERLWCMIPKLHIMHHVCLTLLSQSSEGKLALSPLAHAVQQDEDLVGRGSRLSRRVDSRTASKRVLERLLKASYREFVQAKYILAS